MTKAFPASKSETKKLGRQPSAHARALVEGAFSANVLAHICTTQDFSPWAERVELEGEGRFYYYKDNGSDILAVAHLDHVQADASCEVVETAGGMLALSGALDDRLGAYVILELLPKLGITCDWLLTTDEEMGQSTASDFVPTKDYNWMIQFDRGGTDVVMYQYETDELVELVEGCGARVGQGSYSDIAVLDNIGCAGFNWGVGYQDYHSERSHAWLNDTFRMVARFVKFYQANAETRLVHEEDQYLDESHFLIEADCGHIVDYDDLSTYVESVSLGFICANCAEEFLYFTKEGA